VIYEDTDNPLSAETLALRERRRTDCLDCHNRPSHIVHSPDYLIDHLLLTDRVSPALPEIKTVAVDVLASDYDSVAAARRAIEKKLRSHYRREHPELLSAHPGQLDSAIVAVQEA
jgi:hypothetical protein